MGGGAETPPNGGFRGQILNIKWITLKKFQNVINQ